MSPSATTPGSARGGCARVPSHRSRRTIPRLHCRSMNQCGRANAGHHSSRRNQRIHSTCTGSAVAVKYNSCRRSAARQGHAESVDGQAGAHVVGDRPPDHGTIVQVDHGGRIRPPSPGFHVRDVATPTLIRYCRGEVSAQHIRRIDRFRTTNRGVPERFRMPTTRARRAVIAVPPLLAARVRFTPDLPGDRDQLVQRMPMGRVINVNVVYDEPFCRRAGSSGRANSDHRPLGTVFDNTPREGSPGVLAARSSPPATRSAQPERPSVRQHTSHHHDSSIAHTCSHLHPRPKPDPPPVNGDPGGGVKPPIQVVDLFLGNIDPEGGDLGTHESIVTHDD
jgi:hypothetical protein